MRGASVCIYIYIGFYMTGNEKVRIIFARNIEQGATHVSGLPAFLTAAAAKERRRVGTGSPLAALAV